MSVEYPKYYKLINNKSFYVLQASDKLREYQSVGTQAWFIYDYHATTMPLKYLIMDILNNEGGRWKEISKDEFDQFESENKDHFKL